MKEETVGIPPLPHSLPPLKRTYKEDWREGCTIKKRTAGPHYFDSRTVDCTSGVTCISFPFASSHTRILLFFFHRTKNQTSSLSCVEALFMKKRYGLCSLPGKMNFLCTHGHIFVSSSFPLYHWSVIKNTYMVIYNLFFQFRILSGYSCGLRDFVWMAKDFVCGALDDTSSLG